MRRFLPFPVRRLLRTFEVWILLSAMALGGGALWAISSVHASADAAHESQLKVYEVRSAFEKLSVASWSLASFERLGLVSEVLLKQFTRDFDTARATFHKELAALEELAQEGVATKEIESILETSQPFDAAVQEMKRLALTGDARAFNVMSQRAQPNFLDADDAAKVAQDELAEHANASKASVARFTALGVLGSLLLVALSGIVNARRRARAMAAEQDRLRAGNQRLREVDRLKDEFIAVVSHELRTPLTSIRGYLELLVDGDAGELTLDQEHFVSVVVRNADRLQRLVGDLLFVAQMDAGRLSLAWENLDAAEVVSDAVLAAQPSAASKDVELVFAPGDEPFPVVGDRARLGQVMDNLLTNAIKFTPAGGRVTVAAEGEGDSVVVVFRDTGIGIPEDERQHVFDRFFRAAAANEQAIQGSGLGLSIVKAIVEGHGGEIAVDCPAGGGTEFTVRLTLSEADQMRYEEEAA